jgi:regulator of replication initiation timing
MEIEKLRKENLTLENENLKARLQLQQQSGQTSNAPTSKPPQ